MPKRRERDNQNRRGDEKRSRRPKRKHLYLVLDDWIKGFSVYKIDAGIFDSDEEQGPSVAGRLPEPPALRLETPEPNGDMFFTAMDGKIFAVTDPFHGQTPALVYDTETAGLAIGPAVPAHLECGFDIVVAARGTLYAFSPPDRNEQHSFQVMSWVAPAGDGFNDTRRYPPREEDCRSWKALRGPPLPFDVYEVITAYAVHPDGRTIFRTTACRDGPNLPKSTYSLSSRYRVWRWHDWALPFRGQGHFDGELDAWVRLHRDGYICCCQVPSDVGSETPVELGTSQLDLQRVEDELLPRKENEKHLTASLT